MNLTAKFRVRFLVALAITLCFVNPNILWGQAGPPSGPANLLVNPGFETGNFTGWTVTGNSPNYGVNQQGFVIGLADIPSIVLVHSGKFAGYAVVCYTFCNRYLDLTQTVNLVPGATYEVAFWLGDGTATGLGNSAAISVDGMPILLTYAVQLEPGYQFVGGAFVAANGSSVITFHIEGSGTETVGLSFDDFCLAATPSNCHDPYGFQSIVFPGDTFTETLGINNANLIAGFHGSSQPQGFVLSLPNNFTQEDFPGATETEVTGINNAGDTSGWYVDQNGVTHGFLRIGGIFSTVDYPGTAFNQLLGLNDGDEAAGYWQDQQGNQFPYTVKNGVFTPLQSLLPPNISAQATGVNNAGMVSGSYVGDDEKQHGFLLSGNSVITLDYTSARWTQALGLNNSGQVVGSFLDVSGAGIHGFVYTVASGRYANIDNLTFPCAITFPCFNTIINGINDQGDIIGYSTDRQGDTSIGFLGRPLGMNQSR